MNGNAQPRSRGETFKSWVQPGGIILAALWGIYTFVYKEIVAPKSVPVNITLDLQLKKVDIGAQLQELTAVEVKCSARNPSSREIKLLSSVWIAYGGVVTALRGDEPDLIPKATAALRDTTSLAPLLRHVKRDESPMIGAGRLFTDTELKPGEIAGRTIVLYVPKNRYQQIDFIAVMSSSENPRGVQQEWTINDNEVLMSSMYRVDRNGKRSAAELDEKGIPLDKRLWAQQARSYAAISLGLEAEPAKH